MEFKDWSSGGSREAALFLRTVESVYEAATDPERWQDAIDALSAGFPNGHATLVYHDLGEGRGATAKTSGWDSAWVGSYNVYYNQKNPWLAQLKKRPVGKAVPSEFMLCREELTKTEFFNDFLRPQGLISGTGVTIAQDRERFAVVSVLYPDPKDGAAEQNVRFLQRLAPHFQRAIEVNQRLEISAVRSAAAEESLNKLRAGVLLVSTDGRVLFSNRAADAILRLGDGLTLGRGGEIMGASSSISARLRLAIRAAAMPPNLQERQPSGSVMIERPSGRSPYALLVTPVRHKFADLAAEQPSVAIFISQRDFAASPELLSETLGITRAEGRVLSELLDGCSIPDCGARMEISPHTARTHLRHIFEKLGVSSQGQLMQHVAHHPIWMVDAR